MSFSTRSILKTVFKSSPIHRRVQHDIERFVFEGKVPRTIVVPSLLPHVHSSFVFISSVSLFLVPYLLYSRKVLTSKCDL